MKTKQITRPILDVMYSFAGRYPTKESARERAQALNVRGKHAYYTRITERGSSYWDVRTQN